LVVIAACAVQGTPRDKGSEERARAWEALRSRVQEEKYLKHLLAVEATMREMAGALGKNTDEWGLAGLLHDIDISLTAGDPSRHGIVGARILRELGFSEAVAHAVEAHDDQAGVARTSRLYHALYCADQTYWLVMATGASVPSDKLDTAAVWEQVRGMLSKRAVVEKVSKECAAIGFDMPRMIGAALTALRKVSASTGTR
jgi:putative nucleotidyltransferase with HDIG domain